LLVNLHAVCKQDGLLAMIDNAVSQSGNNHGADNIAKNGVPSLIHSAR